MTRDEQLMEKFEEFWGRTAGGSLAYRSDLRLAFLAGANAAMDLQFEPGAVRFGKPTATSSAVLRDGPDGDIVPDFGTPPTFMGKPVVFVDEPFGPDNIEFGPPPDLGGES